MRSLFSKIGWIIFVSSFVTPGFAVNAEAQQTKPASATTNEVPQAIRDMQQVEDRWSTAVNKRDQYGLELVLSPQFIGVSAAGDVTTRDQQIARLFVKEAQPVSLDQKVVSVRTIDNVAIVNGTYVMHWKLANGPLDEKGVYSHVFQHTRGGWVCLNSQQTVVAEGGKASETKETKEKSKTSSAALPFHIPLIYKGPKSTQPEPAPGSETPPN
jgi:ketosteroid isomerase-like protein